MGVGAWLRDDMTCRRCRYWQVLQWAREHDCPWNKQMCEAESGWESPRDAGIGAHATIGRMPPITNRRHTDATTHMTHWRAARGGR